MVRAMSNSLTFSHCDPAAPRYNKPLSLRMLPAHNSLAFTLFALVQPAGAQRYCARIAAQLSATLFFPRAHIPSLANKWSKDPAGTFDQDCSKDTHKVCTLMRWSRALVFADQPGMLWCVQVVCDRHDGSIRCFLFLWSLRMHALCCEGHVTLPVQNSQAGSGVARYWLADQNDWSSISLAACAMKWSALEQYLAGLLSLCSSADH